MRMRGVKWLSSDFFIQMTTYNLTHRYDPIKSRVAKRNHQYLQLSGNDVNSCKARSSSSNIIFIEAN